MVDGGHPLNPAAVVSMTACVIGLLFGTTTFALSAAPRMRGARIFAFCCILGGLYSATNAALSSESEVVARVGLRSALLLTAFHGASWYWFTATRQGRTLFPWEKGIIAGAVAFGVVTPVPHVLFHEELWVHEVPWLGIRYFDWHSTWLGNLAFAYFAVAMAILFGRSVRRYAKADRIERAETFGLGVLLACGVNDALVSADVMPLPYILDIGFLALVVTVAGSLAHQFVDNARALETAQAELVRSERLAALGEMSAVVAHEVRNPVAIIFNAVSQLRKGTSDQEQLLAIVHDEAERLKRMASDLLEFARPTHVTFGRANLTEVVEGAVAATTSGHQGDLPLVQVNLEGCPGVLECDHTLLRQALVNLISNALQSRSRRGPVKLIGHDEGENLRLEVVDDGEGVARDTLGKIFTPFFTTRATGTGLGLSVVQRIAQAHHGELRYHPTEGGGATFELVLPKTQPAETRTSRA